MVIYTFVHAGMNLSSFRTNKRAVIYKNLSVAEADLLGVRHNLDNEFQHKMTNIEMLRYMRSRYIANGSSLKDNLKEKIGAAFGWDLKKVASHDNYFQLAFAPASFWEKIEVLVNRHLAQYSTEPAPTPTRRRGSRKSVPMEFKPPKEFPITPFRQLQGLDLQDALQLLSSVVDNQFDLKQMANLAIEQKAIKRCQEAICNLAGKESYSLVQETYHLFASANLNQWARVFQTRLDKKDYPKDFSQWVASLIKQSSHKVQLNQSIGQEVAVGPLRAVVFKADVLDVCRWYPKGCAPSFVSIDPPQGLTNEDWDVEWTSEVLQRFVESLKAVLPQDHKYNLGIWVSDQQTYPFKRKLEELGFSTVYVFVWHKPNTVNSGGPRPIWSFEKYLLASNHAEVASIWNLQSQFSLLRRNVWTYDALLGGEFAKDLSTGELLNPCQKPAVLRFHELYLFAKSGSFVCDFCCGTGSMTSAALAFGCNVVACDMRDSQINHVLSCLRSPPEKDLISVGHYDHFLKPFEEQPSEEEQGVEETSTSNVDAAENAD